MLDELHQQRLRSTLTAVEAAEARGEWYQYSGWGSLVLRPGSPECGTACCFAGWGAMIEPAVVPLWAGKLIGPRGNEQWVGGFRGGEPLERITQEIRRLVLNPIDRLGRVGRADIDMALNYVQVSNDAPDGVDGVEPIEDWAREYFGLTDTQAMLLFRACNSLDDLRLMVKELCDLGDILTPPGNWSKDEGKDYGSYDGRFEAAR